MARSQSSKTQGTPTDNSRLLQDYTARRSQYEEFASTMASLLTRLSQASGVIVEMSFRAKEAGSLRAKLERKSYARLDEVPDLAGIRLIVQYPSDIQEMAKVIYEEFAVIDDDEHASARPETFGYASRHLIVRLGESRESLNEWKVFAGLACEIQVRTILQHAWATISHSLDYKTQEAIPVEVRRKLFQVAALIEVGDSIFQAFHEDVASLQNQYNASTSSGVWRDLPINSESLTAAFDEWKPRAAIEYFSKRKNIAMEKSDQRVASFHSQIASLCSAMQIENLGDLSGLLESPDALHILKAEFDDEGVLNVVTPDFISLLELYLVARSRAVTIPKDVEASRLDAEMRRNQRLDTSKRRPTSRDAPHS